MARNAPAADRPDRLAAAAPAARAEITDTLPVLGPADGVRLTNDNRLQFGPQAAKLYRYAIVTLLADRHTARRRHPPLPAS
jgi:hypothetical protein